VLVHRVALAAVAAAVVLLVSAGSAQATCSSSSPSSVSYNDPPGDVISAIDILNVGASLDGACTVTVNPLLAGPLTENDFAITILNTDGNAFTGAAALGGADVAVGVSGTAAGNTPPVIGVWNGADFVFSPTPLTPVGGIGFSASLDQLGIRAPGIVGVSVSTVYTDPVSAANDDEDDAPDVPVPFFPFPVNFASPPPPPPPAPPTVIKDKKKQCTVPKLKGKSVKSAKKKLAAAGCKYKIKGKGKVSSTVPKAGAKTSGTVQVKAKKKKHRKAHHKSRSAATRSVERAIRAAAAR
jgi:hypothetical protein